MNAVDERKELDVVSPSRVRLGVIGAGYIAGVHVRAAAAAGVADQVHVCAIADARPGAAESLVRLQGHGSAYGDVGTMLADEHLDGVLIATWPSNHVELIQQCVEAGVRYVLCEKPFVLTGDEARTVWSLVARTGAVVTEAFMYRHHPALHRIDDLLASGELGTIDHVRASFTYVNRAVEQFAPEDAQRPWRLQAELGGGALYDIGAYAVNACRHVAGSVPARVAAFGRPRNAYGTSDQLHGLVEYANGVIGIIQASETAESTQELEIYANRGIVQVPLTWTIYGESQIVVRRSPDAVHLNPDRHFRTLSDRLSVPQSNAFADQLRQAAAVIRGEQQPRVTLAETVANTLTIEAVAHSLENRETVEVDVPADVSALLEPDSPVRHRGGPVADPVGSR